MQRALSLLSASASGKRARTLGLGTSAHLGTSVHIPRTWGALLGSAHGGAGRGQLDHLHGAQAERGRPGRHLLAVLEVGGAAHLRAAHVRAGAGAGAALKPARDRTACQRHIHSNERYAGGRPRGPASGTQGATAPSGARRHPAPHATHAHGQLPPPTTNGASVPRMWISLQCFRGMEARDWIHAMSSTVNKAPGAWPSPPAAAPSPAASSPSVMLCEDRWQVSTARAR